MLTKPKERKNEVNEIEKIYVEHGVKSELFMKQLISFIGFVLNRYSGNNVLSDDMVHFTYLRILERLGIIAPDTTRCCECQPKEKPFLDKVRTIADIRKNVAIALENKRRYDQWSFGGKNCLFDIRRSNMGNYIFSISRNAHSNYTYHDSKKLRELDPPPVEISEIEVQLDLIRDEDTRVLTVFEENLSYFPNSLRRYLIWKNRK